MAAKTFSNGNPIVVTSADTFATVPLSEAKVKITGIYWETGSAAAAADTTKVTHADGTLIWESTLIASQLGDRSLTSVHIEAKGLAIVAPTHGTLFVYLMDSYG